LKKVCKNKKPTKTKKTMETKLVTRIDDEKLKVKFCPGKKCGQAIEKKGGCNFIKCPICKTRWCWICNKEKGLKGEDKCFNRSHR
jgi:hypothetical protein